jgi:N6-L-threonylcarbamoyladenine synthase
MKAQTILAIETSCDETSAAVLSKGRILSNLVASQIQLHSKYGGVVPEVAAREHVNAIIPVIDLSLKQAKKRLSNITHVAVTQGPGLVTSLLVGIDTAKTLALALNKPLIPINHLEAHIYANFTEEKRPKFPALILIVSGGHTMIVLMRGHGDYRLLGETVDDAAGEAFDKTAKLLGLGYPGGPKISKRAEMGDPQSFKLPRPMLAQKNLNFSFSGLKTAVLYEFTKQKTKNKKLVADLSASVQEAIVDTLIGKMERALEKHKVKSVMLGGGVAANKLLRERFGNLAKKRKLSCFIPKLEHCTDNAGMIGLAAHYGLKHKIAIIQEGIQAVPGMELR